MGDPRKQRKKFKGPAHPWEKSRLEEEGVLKKEYSLKNKQELWKANSLLKHFADQAKRLVAASGDQAEKEQMEVLKRAKSIGLLPESGVLNDVLSMSIKDVLERRLQTVLFRKGLARSMSQARQFIVHRHVSIGDKKITVPSYIVKVDEEKDLGFAGESSLANLDHPERFVEKLEVVSGEATSEGSDDKESKNKKPSNKGKKSGKSKTDSKKTKEEVKSKKPSKDSEDKAESKKEVKKEAKEVKKEAKEVKKEAKKESKSEKANEEKKPSKDATETTKVKEVVEEKEVKN